MAFGDIKGTKTGNGTSVLASSPCATGTNFAVVVGDLIFAVFGQETNVTVTACTDNLGNTYTAFGPGADAGAITGRAFWTRVTVAGTITGLTFTATGSTSNYACAAVGFEGPFATSPLDAQPAGILNDLTTPYTCPATGVLAQADEKIVNVFAVNGNPTLTATAPNLKAIDVATASVMKVAIGHQTVSSTASVTPAWTSSAAPTRERPRHGFVQARSGRADGNGAVLCLARYRHAHGRADAGPDARAGGDRPLDLGPGCCSADARPHPRADRDRAIACLSCDRHARLHQRRGSPGSRLMGRGLLRDRHARADPEQCCHGGSGYRRSGAGAHPCADTDRCCHERA